MNIKNIVIILLLSTFALVFSFWYFNQISQKSNMQITSNGKIRYVAIGDSYTIGYGVSEKNRWPNVLVYNLKKEGINISLVANPSVSGFSVRDAIEFELSEVERIKPDFVTILIGANDSFRQEETKTYQKDLIELLDRLEKILPNPKNIILITIPDYSISPQAFGFPKEELSKLIQDYNEVIKEEGNKRGLRVADIFPVSQTMIETSDYIEDGLHLSAKGYLKWEKVIFPVVFDFLKDK